MRPEAPPPLRFGLAAGAVGGAAAGLLAAGMWLVLQRLFPERTAPGSDPPDPMALCAGFGAASTALGLVIGALRAVTPEERRQRLTPLGLVGGGLASGIGMIAASSTARLTSIGLMAFNPVRATIDAVTADAGWTVMLVVLGAVRFISWWLATAWGDDLQRRPSEPGGWQRWVLLLLLCWIVLPVTAIVIDAIAFALVRRAGLRLLLGASARQPGPRAPTA